MKKIFLHLMVLVFALLLLNTAQAQSDEEDYTVVLPDAAQVCVLPAAPDAIPEEATYDELVAAKGGVATFQGALEEYRTCLKAAEDGDEELTAGNKQALIASYNYSVDMEERVAQRFNEAVRSYKERNPSQ
ncbi:MAG TPA: hypothetical protein VKN35_09510 [Xanthomonadales bacterium]|nr:hypothetical protein [Xanthomonadales bacterium]